MPSGVSFRTAWARLPTGVARARLRRCSAATRTSGTATDGRYTQTRTIPVGAVDGTYTVWVQAQDTVGNTHNAADGSFHALCLSQRVSCGARGASPCELAARDVDGRARRTRPAGCPRLAVTNAGKVPAETICPTLTGPSPGLHPCRQENPPEPSRGGHPGGATGWCSAQGCSTCRSRKGTVNTRVHRGPARRAWQDRLTCPMAVRGSYGFPRADSGRVS